MSREPKAVVEELLRSTTDPVKVRQLVAPDVTYVSLNYENVDLQRIMPWCGTSTGPEAIVSTFTRVAQFWRIDSFTPEVIFGEGTHVAVFGRFTYTSAVLGKTVTSPFAIYCEVVDGKVTYMQFMEDTLRTSWSFKEGGTWRFRSDPEGGAVEF
jgi:uncharacterized protein